MIRESLEVAAAVELGVGAIVLRALALANDTEKRLDVVALERMQEVVAGHGLVTSSGAVGRLSEPLVEGLECRP
jgi:hypothetical protein